MSKQHLKTSKATCWHIKVLSVFMIIILTVQCGLPAFAAISENGRYENRYNMSSDLGNFTVSEGDSGQSVFVINTDDSVVPYPGEGGVAEMRLIKSGSVTEANFNQEFKDNPVFSFGENERVSVEMKFRFTSRGNVKKLLRLDDTSGSSVINGNYLLEMDDGQIYSGTASGKQLLAGAKSSDDTYTKNQWYHVFLVLQGNTYDVYFEGRKINQSPLTLSDGRQSSVTRVVNAHRTWSDESSFYDDLIIQPLENLRLESSSVADGAVNVSEKISRLTLDFNTLLDDAAASEITVTDELGVLGSGYTVELDSLDASRVNILFDGNLTLSNTYTIHYNGMTDVFGSSSDASMSFTTRDTPSPAIVESTSPTEGETEVSFTPTVTFTFNKNIDESSLSVDCVTVLPITSVSAVTLTDARTVAVTFGSDLKPNRVYTVGLTDGILDSEDGLQIKPASVSFTTAYTKDMIIDEFEFALEGFIPNLVGITDNTGKVVSPSAISSLPGDLGFTIDIADPVNYDGDTSRFFLGNGVDDTRLIYKFDEGVRDAVLSVFSNLSPSNPAATYDLQFAVADSITDLNSTDNYIDVTNQVVRKQLSNSAKDGFYHYSYTYKAEDSVHSYFIVRMHRLMDGSAWTPKVANIKFNSMPPATAEVKVIESSDAVQMESAKEIVVPFTLALDDETLRPELFEINGEIPDGAFLNAAGDAVVLTGLAPLAYSTYAVMNLSEGLEDIYGRPVLPGCFTLLAPHEVQLQSAALSAMTALPSSGSVVPQVMLKCHENGASAIVYAIYYVDNKAVDISIKKVEGLYAGENEIELPSVNVETNAKGSYVAVFVRTGGGMQRPVSDMIIIDSDGIRR